MRGAEEEEELRAGKCERIASDPVLGTERGSDELFCDSSSSPNLSAMTAVEASDCESVSKTPKTCGQAADLRPSRVLHLHKLPWKVKKEDVIALASPFGKVTNLLLLESRRQAFLEMCSEEVATEMVRSHSLVSFHIRGNRIHLQYSIRKEVKIYNPSQQARANAALQTVSGEVTLEGAFGDAAPAVHASPVLHVFVDNLFFPISLDVLHQIFSTVGTVLKVITFTRNYQFQVLLQYADAQHAQQAKFSLNGRNIDNTCCTLRIESSNVYGLNVKFNNDTSRDFTRPELPQRGGVGAVAAFQPATVVAAFGQYGSSFPAATGFPQSGLNGPGIRLGPPAAAAEVGVIAPSALVAPLSTDNSVLLALNLNDEVVTLQSLFILFGVYGDVLRVKFLRHRKDRALIQMSDSVQAQLVLYHLNGVRLYSNDLRVILSRHQTVHMPQGHDDQDVAKDFTGSQLHRFKKPGSRNFRNICSPSSTLHLSNILPTVGEEKLRKLFSDAAGGNVQAFKFFKETRTMALLQLGTVEEATIALIKLHNHNLGNKDYLRVSFSKYSCHSEINS